MGHGVQVYLMFELSEMLNVMRDRERGGSVNKRAVQKFGMERPILKKDVSG
jgi:hypothetical protein